MVGPIEADSPVAVIGARGKTGRAVAESLHGRDVPTRPLGRAELVDPVAALRGCDVIYLIAPNLHPDEPAFVERILGAAAETGVKTVIYHSVLSPDEPSMPHHLGKAACEDLIRRSSGSWTVLRPSCYLQNFLPALRTDPPALRVPYATTSPFTFVDLQDVADAAAEVIVSGTHGGATYELGGSEPTTLEDLAGLATTILCTDVPAERLDPDVWATTQGASMDPRERRWLLAMFDHYDHHGLVGQGSSASLSALLHREPTSMEATLRRTLSRRS